MVLRVQERFKEVQEEMIEQYKGYEIKVNQSSIYKGYVFCVFDTDGIGIKESGPYVYEENALLGARETVDEIIQKKRK